MSEFRTLLSDINCATKILCYNYKTVKLIPMFKKKNPKLPSDYKTLRIRVPPEVEVEKILNDVEKVRLQLNKNKPPERKMWMGNHVLLEAIEIGLKDLRKRKG